MFVPCPPPPPPRNPILTLYPRLDPPPAQKVELNQYFFSKGTIAVLTAEIEEQAPADSLIAFLSTPSLYFSLFPATRQHARLLEIDDQWALDPGFVLYDYRHPEALPAELHHRCGMVVIDPPFISRDAWVLYVDAVRLLLRKEGATKILCTTVGENAAFLKEMLGVEQRRFLPSIPKLVYQFSVYTDFASQRLDQPNPELEDGEEKKET